MNANSVYQSRRDKKGSYKAFFEFTSALLDKKGLDSVLKIVASNAFSFFIPNRSTIFARHPNTGIVDIFYRIPPAQPNEIIGPYEERIIARKAFQQNNIQCLLAPKDFSIFFNKHTTWDINISQIISFPLINVEISKYLLSLVFINDNFALEDDDLIVLQMMRNIALIAHKISYLENKYYEWTSLTTHYKDELDKILITLENLSQVGSNLAEEHILEMTKREFLKKEDVANIKNHSTIPSTSNTDDIIDRRSADRVHSLLPVYFENDPSGMTRNISSAGAFIETSNPLDFAEEFSLRLHLDDGHSPIDIKSKVIWTNIYATQTALLQRGMGVKFLNLSNDSKNRIESYLKTIKTEAKGEIL